MRTLIRRDSHGYVVRVIFCLCIYCIQSTMSFLQAYPAETVARDLRVSPGTIMLSTAISGVLYLKFSESTSLHLPAH